MHARDAERVEKRDRIQSELLEPIGPGRDRGRSVAAHIKAQDAKAPAERWKLRLPHGEIGPE